MIKTAQEMRHHELMATALAAAAQAQTHNVDLEWFAKAASASPDPGTQYLGYALQYAHDVLLQDPTAATKTAQALRGKAASSPLRPLHRWEEPALLAAATTGALAGDYKEQNDDLFYTNDSERWDGARAGATAAGTGTLLGLGGLAAAKMLRSRGHNLLGTVAGITGLGAGAGAAYEGIYGHDADQDSRLNLGWNIAQGAGMGGAAALGVGSVGGAAAGLAGLVNRNIGRMRAV